MRMYWKVPVDGNYFDASAWSSGTVPSAGDRIYLLGTSNYAVTTYYTDIYSFAVEALSLQTSASATLNIENPLFYLTAGTGTGASAGTINVDQYSFLLTQGIFRNSGIINLSGTLQIGIGYIGQLRLEGGGEINLVGSQAWIVAPDGGRITNADNNISGNGKISGHFENGLFGSVSSVVDGEVIRFDPDWGGSLYNAGTISASFGGAVQVETETVNAGTIFALNGGTIRFYENDVINSGAIKALGGSIVTFTAGTVLHNSSTGFLEAIGTDAFIFAPEIIGGTLRTENGGKIFVRALDGKDDHPITNTGTVVFNFDPGSLAGTIHNSGEIEIGDISLRLEGSSPISFDGHGELSLAHAHLLAFSGAQVFVNKDNHIVGHGVISGDLLNIINNKAGTIEALAQRLILDTGDGLLANYGLLKANGGTLLITGDVSNNGTIAATSGGTVIVDGTVSGRGTAVIEHNSELEFSGLTLVDVRFASGDGSLVLGDADLFSGRIKGFNEGDAIDLLDVDFSNATLSFKKGTLTVSDGADAVRLRFSGDYSLSDFQIASDGFGGTLLL